MKPRSDRTLYNYPQGDPLDGCRGIVLALLAGAIMWGIVLGLLAWAFLGSQ